MGRSWKRAQPQGPAPRQFLTRQNSLHWVMDMIFRDDECRIRTDHAPANFTTIKHMAQNLIRKAQARTHSALGAKPPPGTTTSSQASSPHDSFTRFPWYTRYKMLVLLSVATTQCKTPESSRF